MFNAKNTMMAMGAIAALSVGVPAVANAGLFGDKEDEMKTSQISQVKINITEAIQKAQEKHSGTIIQAKLEDEDGRFVYEIEYFDNDKETEMLVDAMTGEVTSGEDDEAKNEKDY